MSLAESIESLPPSGKFSDEKQWPVRRSMCTGCGLCMAVCPVHAISMKEDKESGFLYPNMDKGACIQCGTCRHVCPDGIIREERLGYSDVYAANNGNIDVRNQSASGGLFSAFAAGMLRNGGCVAGTAFEGKMSCRHVIAETKEELKALRGTKYFQSDMSSIYESILHQKKDILFCGTPCQVHALKVYAMKKGFADKLILIDLLCRGVPSPYVYRKYIELLEKEHGAKVQRIRFKEKTRGWDKIGTMVFFENGNQKCESREDSVFAKSFIESNLAVRESCFYCKYKTIYREGDITIADFWGLKNHHLLDNKGTSLVIVNTEKGRMLFDGIKQDIDYIPSTMWRVYRGNGAAFHRIYCDPEQRKRFFALLHEGKDLREAVSEVLDREP